MPAQNERADSPPAWQLKRTSRRTVAIYIRRDGHIEVRAPLRYPLNAIEAFVVSRQTWIGEQLRRLSNLPKSPQWGEGRQWWHQGQAWPVRIEQYGAHATKASQGSMAQDDKPASSRRRRTQVDFDAGGFCVRTSAAAETWPAIITKALQHWQAAEAKRLLPARVETLVACHGEAWRPTALRFRCLRSRWGSCSADGRIMLNTQLMQLPEVLVDYVICHEMAHLREMNHSAAFYAVQAQLNPQWQVQRVEMKQWASRLVTNSHF
ncbi:MAG: SprT family zinc-dependent metalloprotease [Paraperlucidibaca sp.]